ncbi:hypothetical protein PAMP_020793 [Pampus punctatissimus]
MSPRKCFFGCEGKLNLFAFPKEENTSKLWIQFLFVGQQQPYTTVFLCSRHFTEDCFLNRAQYEAGFSARLVLRDGAVPSIKGRVEESQAQASTSQQTPTAQYKHTGCQTDRELTVSVATQFCPYMVSVGTQFSYSASTKSAGTQLSYSTLKQHVRSKATQVTVSCHEVHEGSMQHRNHSIQVFTPEMCAVTIEKPAPQHIVDEEAIMQLMKTCPMCDRKCRCTKHTRGPYFIVYQNCYFCDFQRKWASQPEAINANAYKAYMPSRKKFKSNDMVTVEAEAQSSQLNKTSVSESSVSESNQPLQSCVTVSALSLGSRSL